VIFHHDPLHDDNFLDLVGEQAAQVFPNTQMAREGMSIQLPVPAPQPEDLEDIKMSV
ncbi:MAG TPA: MBL fold metallo-hydrolase, partial [Phormidium sp.]